MPRRRASGPRSATRCAAMTTTARGTGPQVQLIPRGYSADMAPI